MGGIKKITEDVPVIESIDDDAEPSVYIEHKGTFCRAKGRQARKALGLGEIVCVNGQLCVEIDEET